MEKPEPHRVSSWPKMKLPHFQGLYQSRTAHGQLLEMEERRPRVRRALRCELRGLPCGYILQLPKYMYSKAPWPLLGGAVIFQLTEGAPVSCLP